MKQLERQLYPALPLPSSELNVVRDRSAFFHGALRRSGETPVTEEGRGGQQTSRLLLLAALQKSFTKTVGGKPVLNLLTNGVFLGLTLF
ncbi:MAG: hypothetical protein O7J95_20275 [Planctomycetota bacterium]|nr:hypothetical protein [Planctomycetota bacterium]